MRVRSISVQAAFLRTRTNSAAGKGDFVRSPRATKGSLIGNPSGLARKLTRKKSQHLIGTRKQKGK